MHHIHTSIFEQHPILAKRFELLYQTRCSEFLENMLETDSVYACLQRERANASMELMDALGDIQLFDKYSDTVYALEIYEHEIIYRQALKDAWDLFREHIGLPI